MSQSYHRIIRKVVIAFGNLFNNINLSRYDANGVEKESFLVPIVYGGKEKYISRLEGDPTLDKKVQVTLPIMSFEMTDMSYDASRKLNSNIRNTHPDGSNDKAYSVRNPVPFDFKFTLWAYVRNIEDGAQLMEKILPFFTPDYTVAVNLIPEMGLVKQLPIILDGVSNEIDYEGDYNSKVRNIIWTLNFTVKGYLYGAVSQPKIIKRSITNIINSASESDVFVFNMTTPGTGNYKIGERIYQGYSIDTADATAVVKDWANGSLYITNVNGNFVTSSNIIGEYTHASYNFSSYNPLGVIPTENVQIVVTPDPENANSTDFYTYTTAISEGINTPLVTVGNSNNQIVFVPSAPNVSDYNDFWRNANIDLMQ